MEVIDDLLANGGLVKEWDHREIEATRFVQGLCTKFNAIMCDLLEIDTNNMHCCIKVFKENEISVETWVRSEPFDERAIDDDPNLHPVAENSTWSALLGKFDGKYNWERKYCCFSCNDLLKYGENYKNSRRGWSRHYKSTFVIPLKFPIYENGKLVLCIIGFLAFDSPKKSAFPSLPDIFEYRETPERQSDYKTLLKVSAVFQLGAVMADILTLSLKSTYEKFLQKGGALMDYRKSIKILSEAICRTWDAEADKSDIETKIIYTPEKFLNAGRKLMRKKDKSKTLTLNNVVHK
jgi:hypothetical protein